MEKTLSEKIKEARTSFKKADGRKLTQSELAEQLGLSTQTISLYETGGREVSIDQLKKIAKATQKPVSWFFDEDTTTQEIRTVTDVIKTLEQLENAFRSCYSVDFQDCGYEGTRTQFLELSFSVPLSYKDVFDQLKTLSEWKTKGMPTEAKDAWYNSIMEKQSIISVDEMY